jgi:hypothetical protein
MNQSTSPNPTPFPLMNSAAWMSLAMSSLAFVVWALLAKFGAPGQAEASLLASVLCAAAGVLSLLPTWWLSKQSMQAGAMGFFVGMMIRMILCGSAALLSEHWLSHAEASQFSLWIAGWYLVTLVLDVWLVGKYVRQTPAQRPMENPAC